MGFGTIRDIVINGDEPNSLRYTGASDPDELLPLGGGKGQAHELTQNFLDIRYATGPGSSKTARNADGRIRFRVLIEEPSE